MKFGLLPGRYLTTFLPKLISILLVLLLSTTVSAVSVDQMSDESTVYMLFSAPHKIERFSLTSGEALEPVTLDKEPTALFVHEDVAYVAFHRELREIDLNTGESEFIKNFPDPIMDLLVARDTLFVLTPTGYDGTVTAVSLSDHSVTGETEPRYSGNYFAASDDGIFYRSTGVSPSDIHKISIGEQGEFLGVAESPYHGAYPSASRVWASPDGSRVFDDSGIVYFAENLTYAGSLGGKFDGLVFVDGNPVVARSTNLNLYTNHLLEVGKAELALAPTFLASHDQIIYGFSFSNSSYEVDSVDVSAFELPSPGEPLDGNTTSYMGDTVISDGEDIIYSVDISLLSVFRYSTIEEKHLQSWSLTSPPAWAVYSVAHNRFYLGYDSGKVTYFDVSIGAEAVEQHFTTLPSGVLGLAAVENYLFAVDGSGAWGSFYTFDDTGLMVDSIEWRDPSRDYLWSKTVGKLFHFRDGTSPNDIEWTEIDPQTGVFGDGGDSPYHGDTLRTTSPLRLDPTGELIFNGSGQIVSANTLEVINSLSTSIADAAWVDGQLFSISSQNSQLQVWAEDYELLVESSLDGLGLARIFQHSGQLLVVGYKDGSQEYRLISLLGDDDQDGVGDLLDNCSGIENSEQLDFDSDGVGDLCDSDADNDGIPNELENAANLNYLDPSDAGGDLDMDGYSNRIEALAGTGINDENDTPEPLSYYEEDFNGGWPLGFYRDGSGAYISPNGMGQSGALFVPPSAGQEMVSFNILTSSGVLVADIFSTAEWYQSEALHVFVDGELRAQFDVDSDGWAKLSITLSQGEHTIGFGVGSRFSEQNTHGALVDNLVFGADKDSDGIVDQNDNCPTISNRWQDDNDGDGLGDTCDPMPTDPSPPADTDEDGVYDYIDNCPDEPNPGQKDIDEDGIGDLCDEIDDRPADTDSDGIYDYNDNCPNTPNPEQEDIDNDWLGDACDSTDDRPKDSDSDGEYDRYDNCPSTPNPNQQDFDSDGLGDSCDEDIDGDGISNELEGQYSFLDAFNPADAFMDEDGDGATNLYELNENKNPAIPEDYLTLDLSEYAVILEGRYVFSKPEARLIIDVLHMPETNSYLRTSTANDWAEEFKHTEKGLELIASGEIFMTEHQNHLVLPNSMNEGAVVTLESETIFRGSEFFGEESSINRRMIYLTAQGSFELEGEEYPTVSIQVINAESSELIREEVYAKGLGLVSFNGFEVTRFIQFNPQSSSSDAEGESNDGTNDKGKSGGSLNIHFLLFLTLFSIIFRGANVARK